MSAEALEASDDLAADIASAVDATEKVKERLKSDPDSVRKLLAGEVTVDENVTVYPNKPLLKEYAELQGKVLEFARRVARLEDESDEDFLARVGDERDEYSRLDGELDALREKIEETAVTFHLVSVSKKAIKNLRTTARKKFPTAFAEATPPEERVSALEDLEDYYKASIVAAHLIQDGYTVEDVLTIQSEWPTKSWAELWSAANRLSITDDYLQGSIDVDF